ncbi:MAG: T9SS type A sorting domain-containing protein [Chitinophagales bacterium]
MKHFLSVVAGLLIFQSAHAQIVITASDMPVSGDMLSYSNAPITGTGINPGDSGANMTWNYTLSPTSQGVDTYKTAYQVNLAYALTIPLSAFGYKVADSIPGLSMIPGGGLSVTNIYTFFQETTTPGAEYIAMADGYIVNHALPVASKYTNPDVWYFFPLTYGNNTDSADYLLHMGLTGTNSIKQAGYRKTRVDGWGTITTPYFTTPVNCIRVRSEIHEIDSITLTAFTFGIPRNTVEYKWLVNGEHYPALWVTSNVTGGTETITTVRYRDTLQGAGIVNEKLAIYEITAFPNPAANGIVTLGLPADWKTFQVEVFDIQSKQVAAFNNEREINIRSLSAGRYFVRITSGSKVGYAMVTR